jgi:hypothetical protein
VLVKSLVKEAYKLLLIPASKVALNSFNASYEGMDFCLFMLHNIIREFR